MKERYVIKEEIEKHKECLKNTKFENRTVEQKIHSAIVEALQWVLEEKDN